MADHVLRVGIARPLPGSDKTAFWLGCPDCDLRVNGRVGPAAQVDGLVAMLTLAHQVQVGAAPCCSMHNEHCEPPADLCCWLCTEAGHDSFPTRHADGRRCVLTEGGEGDG